MKKRTKKILVTGAIAATVIVAIAATVASVVNVKKKKQVPIAKIDENKIIKNKKPQPLPKKTQPLGTIDPTKIIKAKKQVPITKIDTYKIIPNKPFIKISEITNNKKVPSILKRISENAKSEIWEQIYENIKAVASPKLERDNKLLQEALEKARQEISQIDSLSKVEQNEYNQMLSFIDSVSKIPEIEQIVLKAHQAAQVKQELQELFKGITLSNYETNKVDLSFTLSGDSAKIAKIKEYITSEKYGLKVYSSSPLIEEGSEYFDPATKQLISEKNIVDAEEQVLHLYTRLETNSLIPPTTVDFYNDEFKVSVPMTTKWAEQIKYEDKEIITGISIGTTREQVAEFKQLIAKDYNYAINVDNKTNLNDVIKDLKEAYQKGGKEKDKIDKKVIYLNKLLKTIDTLLHTRNQYVQYKTLPTSDQDKYDEFIKKHIATSFNEIWKLFENKNLTDEIDTKISNLLNVQFMALSDLDTYKSHQKIDEWLSGDVDYTFTTNRKLIDVLKEKLVSEQIKLKTIEWLVNEIFKSSDYELSPEIKDQLLLEVIDKDQTDGYFDYQNEIKQKLEKYKKNNA
ncbi:hypothetical protein [Metamycoplasma canadense]|uniref:Lipoprotein n=1 Tax=Metamycoplasma canadense TaxID=29554 RepID=A0A077L6H5_9BACT|nr:hypothetical protein [Metamycoplasma canadense]BAP39572.1 hypothetical protein MCAN360_0423 [Metamycoplasma canadense]